MLNYMKILTTNEYHNIIMKTNSAISKKSNPKYILEHTFEERQLALVEAKLLALLGTNYQEEYIRKLIYLLTKHIRKRYMKHLTDDEHGLIVMDVINIEYKKLIRYRCYEDKQLVLAEQKLFRLLNTNYQAQYEESYMYLLARKAKRDYENFKQR